MSEEDKSKKGELIVVQVTKQFKEGKQVTSEETETDIMDAVAFPDEVEPASASFNAGLTINLGNFESVKVGYHVSVPCYKEELDDAFKFARDSVMERLLKEKKSVEKKLKKGN